MEEGARLGLRAWHSPTGAGSVVYVETAGYRVAAGAPRVRGGDPAALFAEFADDCARRGLRRVHFGLPGPMRAAFGNPAAHLRIGDLPLFDLNRWLHDASMPSGIRAQARRARRRGIAVRHLSRPPEDPRSLHACLQAWLRAKPLPPLGFLTMPFLFDPWPREGLWVAERGNVTVGFLSASRVLFGGTLRVDAVGRAPDAPNGTAELLVSEAFRAAAERGIDRATLGLAPLARRAGSRDPGARAAIHEVVSALGRRLLSPLYSFEGLEAFKAKFAPDAWLPLYCSAPGRFVGPRDVLAVARAFAGGSLLRYGARAARWKMGAGAPESGRLASSVALPGDHREGVL